MKTVLAALAFGAAALAPQAHAAPAYRVAADPAADRLVAILLPEQAIVRVTQTVFDNAVNDDANLSPDKKKLYAANPGMKEFVAARLSGELDAVVRQELPAFRVEMSAMVTRELTRQEITDTLTFFDSATGKKMMRDIYSGVAASKAQNEDEARQAAMAAFMANLQPEDYPALMAFGATSAATKLQAVTPKFRELSKNWAERLNKNNLARFTAIGDKATAEFLAKKK